MLRTTGRVRAFIVHDMRTIGNQTKKEINEQTSTNVPGLGNAAHFFFYSSFFSVQLDEHGCRFSL
jgi:hypothetical protein